MKKIFNKTKQIAGLAIVILVLVISCKKDPVPVTGISLDKTDATVQVGNTVTLQAFINPSDADNKKSSGLVQMHLSQQLSMVL